MAAEVLIGLVPCGLLPPSIILLASKLKIDAGFATCNENIEIEKYDGTPCDDLSENLRS